MVPRLIIDVVRRRWHIGAFAVFQLHIFYPLVAKFWPSSAGMAVTMCGGWFLSMASADLFSLRVLFQLPVSRRTWWLARWWMSVVAAVVIAQLASSIGQWREGSPLFGVEYALLSLIFGVLYCGFSMGIRTTPLGKSGVSRRRSRLR